MHRALALFVLLSPLAVHASERATTKEAEAMVHHAVAFLKQEGKEKAFAVFDDPKGAFTFRDLYISVVSLDGKVVAHGTRKDRIGKRYLEMTPAAFKEYFKTVIQQGNGWIEYKYPNPTNGKIEQKVAYAEVAGDVIVTCGAYKP